MALESDRQRDQHTINEWFEQGCQKRFFDTTQNIQYKLDS